MKTYYATTPDGAANILRRGFTDGVIRIGAHRMLGVALFGRITGPSDTWFEVDVDDELIAPYSVPGTAGEMGLWVVPARLLADRAASRLVLGT